MPPSPYSNQPAGQMTPPAYGSQPAGQAPVSPYGNQPAGQAPVSPYGSQFTGQVPPSPYGQYPGQVPSSPYGGQYPGQMPPPPYGNQLTGRMPPSTFGEQPAGQPAGQTPRSPYGSQPADSRKKSRLTPFQIILIVLVVGALAAFLVYTFMPAAATSAVIEYATIGTRYSGDCLIVRDETPYDAEGLSSMLEIAEEGSLVQRGTVICKVYSSGFSTKEMTALHEYRDDIRDYQLKQLAEDTTADAEMDRLDSDLLTRALEVRMIISGERGNLRNHESLLAQAIDARQDHLKTKFKNDQRMSRLYDEETSQLQRISSWTKQYAAMSESLVSFYSDGFEYGLTSSNYDSFTTAEVRRMLNGERPAGSELQKGRTTIYRTVNNGHWYALMLIQGTDWSPEDGRQYELQIGGFENQTVMATVESHTLSGGELLLRLAVVSDVTPVLYIRSCTAEIGSDVNTMMVPERALYTQDNMLGVVVIDGSNRSFIPVNVLGREDGKAYIEAIQQGVLFVGQQVMLF